MARVLEERLVDPAQGQLARPGTRPPRRVLDRELVADRVGVDPREPLDDAEALGAAPVGGADADHVVAERRPLLAAGDAAGLDDEGVALPAAAHLAQPLRDAPVGARPAVEGDDAGVVDHLDLDHDVVGRLQDQVVVVVAGRQHRRPHRPEHAAVVEVHVGPRVRRAALGPRGEAGVLVRLRLGRQRRKPAVGRIDDERRLPRGRGAAIEPEVVVEPRRPVLADVHALGDLGPRRRPREKRRVAVEDLALEVRHLFRRQPLPPRQLRRALQRRDRLVRVGALQIGVAPGRARRRRLAGRRDHRERDDREQDCANEGSNRHLDLRRPRDLVRPPGREAHLAMSDIGPVHATPPGEPLQPRTPGREAGSAPPAGTEARRDHEAGFAKCPIAGRPLTIPPVGLRLRVT